MATHGGIGQTLAGLRTVASEATDAAGYFPALYSRVTADVAEGIRAGRFEDGPRMERLVVTFAAYYLRARRGEAPAPRSWQATWDVAGDDNLLIAQHLLLGINAHINFDLAQAVVDVVPEGGDLQDVRADFDAINDVLAGTFETVITDLDTVSRWTSEAVALGGGRLFNFSLHRARAQAWRSAEILYALDEADRPAHLRELDHLVAVLAYLITRPACPVAVAAWLARHLEEHDPPTVTRALLGPLVDDPAGVST